MHCPVCGQQQVSEETRFCSRCGFLLSGVAEVMAHGGLVPSKPTGLLGQGDSPRRRGLKQGLFLFLMVFLVAPLMGMLTLALNVEPFLVGIGVILCAVGGILRMIYALMFEPGAKSLPAGSLPNALNAPAARPGLAASQEPPASAYTSPAGAWRDTNDLQKTPGSVTDHTTKLLEKERDQ